jgi:signal transduction histidine kinase/CheY-like chemotaxis protein
LRTAFFFGAAFLTAGFATFFTTFFTTFLGAAFFGAAFFTAFFTAFLTAFFGAAFLTAFLGAAFFGAAFFTVRFFAICASFNAEDTFGRVAGAIIAQLTRDARAFVGWAPVSRATPYAMLRDGMQALRRDPIFIAVVAAVLSLAAFSLIFPTPAPLVETVGWWADFPLLGLSAFSAWRAFRADRTAWGRRFWKLISIALCLWFSVLLDWQFSWASRLPFDGEVFVDVLFLAYYFTLLLATAVKPHERTDALPLSPILLTEVVAGLVLAIGLLEYFVLLPSRLTPTAYESYVPSLSLYVLLDVVLVVRVGTWCWRGAGRRWRIPYAALAAAFACTLLHDIHELLVYSAGQLLTPSVWDIIWWAQFACLILAARASAIASRTEDAGPTDDFAPVHQQLFGPVVSFAFILPVIHLGGHLSGLLDSVLDAQREIVVLACAVALGALAVFHQKLMNDQYRVVSRTLHEAQIQLQQSRKMEALGRLAGGVAHGFNNLLSVIVGYTEILMERIGPGEKNLDALQQIRFAAERAATLTRQLATFSRGRLDQEVSLDLDQALVTHVPTIRRMLTEGILLNVVPGSGGAWILVDPQQFERALLNVVANARDAMPGGGTLSITTRALVVAAKESPALDLVPPGPYVEVTVADTGHGMDDDVRSRLFEPFFSTRSGEDHRGLGLPIVYGVVRQASGHIQVDSQPGKGAIVRMYFPRHPAPVEAVPVPAPVAVVARAGTILLAEDERGLRRLMRSTLEDGGFTVLEAGDGGTAVDVADRHSGTIDLLVSDVVMPVLGGPAVARRVLASRPEVRVLFVSGYAPDTLGDLTVPGTVATLLPKPFTMGELLARVRELLPTGPAIVRQERGDPEREVTA